MKSNLWNSRFIEEGKNSYTPIHKSIFIKVKLRKCDFYATQTFPFMFGNKTNIRSVGGFSKDAVEIKPLF